MEWCFAAALPAAIAVGRGKAALVFKKIVDGCRSAYAEEMASLVRNAISHISPAVPSKARSGSPTAPFAPSRTQQTNDLGYDWYKLQNQGQPVRCSLYRQLAAFALCAEEMPLPPW